MSKITYVFTKWSFPRFLGFICLESDSNGKLWAGVIKIGAGIIAVIRLKNRLREHGRNTWICQDRRKNRIRIPTAVIGRMVVAVVDGAIIGVVRGVVRAMVAAVVILVDVDYVIMHSVISH